jgi:thioester reductase-like protein
MTGASGFLGRNLLRRLLEDYPNDRFFLLVRSSATEDFLRKQFSGVIDLNRIVYVRGGVRQSCLRMNERLIQCPVSPIPTISDASLG